MKVNSTIYSSGNFHLYIFFHFNYITACFVILKQLWENIFSIVMQFDIQ